LTCPKTIVSSGTSCDVSGRRCRDYALRAGSDEAPGKLAPGAIEIKVSIAVVFEIE
jgi:hypothetical protein